ncbi:hypothetical protein GC089_12380 [Cellulomonas sp. JZ18]|uniref:hypothetical protein n=1 Tax=Cellulomonas sp. JZ18 TaxID=2654191 RepID=UPI0012D493AC|nr:hypothetical protein [Cellulomonas sp. JZ18]QGQ19866.1 hypothetical protein GC089_12380 [Cellulomonas sp. JZ18]
MTEPSPDGPAPVPDRPGARGPVRPPRSRTATWALVVAAASVLAFVATVAAVAAGIAAALAPERPPTSALGVVLAGVWLALVLVAVVLGLRARRVESERGRGTAAVVVAAVPVALVVGALGAARLA